MDVCVDTKVFGEAGKLIDKLSALDYLTYCYKYIFDGAEEDFSTINYDNARICINTVCESMNQIREILSSVKSYLTKLNELIEEYNKLQY